MRDREAQGRAGIIGKPIRFRVKMRKTPRDDSQSSGGVIWSSLQEGEGLREIMSFFHFDLANPGPHGAFRRAAHGDRCGLWRQTCMFRSWLHVQAG